MVADIVGRLKAVGTSNTDCAGDHTSGCTGRVLSTVLAAKVGKEIT